MKTIRTYLKVCDFCHGTGFVSEIRLSSSSIRTCPVRTCPVCNGAKTIIITETIIDDNEREKNLPPQTYDPLKDYKIEYKPKNESWICPRCFKVHSYLSLTCDCPPSTITTTTLENTYINPD